jgi:hypothetical protein
MIAPKLIYQEIKLSRSVLKIVVMTRQEAEGRRQKRRAFWATLLSVTYFGFFAPFYLIDRFTLFISGWKCDTMNKTIVT